MKCKVPRTMFGNTEHQPMVVGGNFLAIYGGFSPPSTHLKSLTHWSHYECSLRLPLPQMGGFKQNKTSKYQILQEGSGWIRDPIPSYLASSHLLNMQKSSEVREGRGGWRKGKRVRLQVSLALPIWRHRCPSPRGPGIYGLWVASLRLPYQSLCSGARLGAFAGRKRLPFWGILNWSNLPWNEFFFPAVGDLG